MDKLTKSSGHSTYCEWKVILCTPMKLYMGGVPSKFPFHSRCCTLRVQWQAIPCTDFGTFIAFTLLNSLVGAQHMVKYLV